MSSIAKATIISIVAAAAWDAAAAALILRAPRNQTLAVGAQARFAVTLSGAETASIQWFRNGVPIPGANAAEISVTASFDTFGEYTVRISEPVRTIEATALLDIDTAFVKPSLLSAKIVNFPADVPFHTCAVGPDRSCLIVFRPKNAGLEAWKFNVAGDIQWKSAISETGGGVSVSATPSGDWLLNVYAPASKNADLILLSSDGARKWTRRLFFPFGVQVMPNGIIFGLLPEANAFTLSRDGEFLWQRPFLENWPRESFFGSRPFIGTGSAGSSPGDLATFENNTLRIISMDPDGSVVWARNIPNYTMPQSAGVIAIPNADRGVLLDYAYNIPFVLDGVSFSPPPGANIEHLLMRFDAFGSLQWAVRPPGWSGAQILDRGGGVILIGGPLWGSLPALFDGVEVLPSSPLAWLMQIDAAGKLRSAASIPIAPFYAAASALTDAGTVVSVSRPYNGAATLNGVTYENLSLERSLIFTEIAVDAPREKVIPQKLRAFVPRGGSIRLRAPSRHSNRAVAFAWRHSGQIVGTEPRLDIEDFTAAKAGEYTCEIRYAAFAVTHSVADLFWPALQIEKSGEEVILRWDVTDRPVTIERRRSLGEAFSPIVVEAQLNATIGKFEARLPVADSSALFRFAAPE